MDMILCSFETYDKIAVKLKFIKNKINITCYLSSLPSEIAIKFGYQAHLSVSSIFQPFCH